MEFEPSTWMALGWLGLLLVGGLAYFVSLIRHSDYDLWESCLYLPTYLMGRLVWRVHFTNDPPGEIKGGAVLVANHRSSVDPFFVQLAARRRVHWMVAKEYCEHFIFGKILKAVQAIPTNRSGMDTACTKQAMRITSQGRLVGMFPEGQLNHTQNPLVAIRSGAAVIAAKSNVPMIPLYIKGSPYRRTVWSPLFIPAHVAITFGSPIYPVPQTSRRDGLDGSRTSEAEPEISLGYKDEAELVDTDAMMIEWGKQLLALSGMPNSPIDLASKRRRRHNRPNKT